MNASPYPEHPYLYRILTREKLFTPAECEQIIQLNAESPRAESLISDQGKKDLSLRNSQTSVLLHQDNSKWVHERLMKALQEYNAMMKFKIASLEQLQIQAYRPGGFYSWHMDLGEGHMSTRKISVVLLLSAPSQFKGGKLEFWMGSDKGSAHVLEQGDAVFFPPYLLHRVTPVTAGLRHTLVAWVHGPAFS